MRKKESVRDPPSESDRFEIGLIDRARVIKFVVPSSGTGSWSNDTWLIARSIL